MFFELFSEHNNEAYNNFMQDSRGEMMQIHFKRALQGFILLLPPENYRLIWRSETCININHVQDFLKDFL